jgi:anti-sigma regulatory factor (Ser/Thr protein kinase)
VGRTVTEAVAVIAGHAAEREIDVQNDCPPEGEPCYYGDEDRVRQILLNLLTNAVKFTNPGGTIRITCGTSASQQGDVDGGMTWVTVEDTGIGIEQDQLERIFRPFTQVEAGHTRTYGGTGLGLNISRQLARLMDGDLTVVSETGHGSRFTLWLPGTPTPAPTLDEIVQDELSDGRPQGLATVARVLQNEMPGIVESFAERLHAAVGPARTTGFGDRADHTSALIADMSQSLLILEAGRAIPERLLQDGSEIQRLIAELHGRQRAQLGWSAEDLAREFQILRDEITSAIEEARLPSVDREAGIRILLRILDRAEQIAGRTLEHAIATRDLS